MKRICLLIFIILAPLLCAAQQIMYANLDALVEGRGDTVTILKVEKRAKGQLFLTGGADYRIEAEGNRGLSRYLRRRCYAVQVDTQLFVNCRKMRYKRFRLGGWYAPAFRVGKNVYYSAQPVGQVAASTATPPNAVRLGGDVGSALAASGLVHARVYYELDTASGKSYFRTILHELIAALKRAQAEEILVKGHNSFAVDPETFDCDYYRFLQGDPAAVNAFQNDYMQSYSWAEIRNAELDFWEYREPERR